MLGLLLNGTAGVAVFIVPWPLLLLAAPKSCGQCLRRYAILFLFPAYSLLSSFWSDEPLWTLKASLEYVATAAIAILAGAVIEPVILLDGLLVALLCIAIASAAVIASGPLGSHVVGIVGSKNAFAYIMSLLFLNALAVLIGPASNWFFKSAALVGMIITAPLLYLGNSIGSIAAVLFAASCYAVTLPLKRLPPAVRLVGLLAGGCLLVAGVAAWVFAELSLADVLNMVGKDATGTGRGFIWSRGLQYIAERPWLGTGYGAFWRVWNPHAQEIWHELGVPPGSGFNFHNEYIHWFVDLGLGGFLLAAGFIVAMSVRMYRTIIAPRFPEQAFALLVWLYMLPRTMIEQGIFSHFQIGFVLFCVLWIHLTPAMKRQAAAVPLIRTSFAPSPEPQALRRSPR